MIRIEGIRDFDLEQIFTCGQCFRWEREENGSYTGVAYKKIVTMGVENSLNGDGCKTLYIENATEEEFQEIWKNYLDLGRDYGEIKHILKEKDSILAQAISYGEGIRILRQEPWETVVSFIISQNNNIPRIKKCIEALCETFGEAVGVYKGKTYYAVPEPQVLAQLTEKELAPIKLGYRAKYLIETAKLVSADRVNLLNQCCDKTAEEAYGYLTSLNGIGPKVAHCILLFSMSKMDSFPIDVWVKRVMNQLYGISQGDIKAMKDYAKANFGVYGGIAQQYLFYFIRVSEEGEKINVGTNC